MYRITVSAGFSAAHHLREYKGKCENQHGHNWHVTATVCGESLGTEGMLIDFGELRQMLREVCGELDHRDINTHPHFALHNPSAENIATWIFSELERKLSASGCAALLDNVTVEETDGSVASWSRS